MRVAVVTLTRDRLDFTKHCFNTLRSNAGIKYDHIVLDQGSTDGTVEWLVDQPELSVISMRENMGICPALNYLLDREIDPENFDVIVRWDNDCEVLTPNTLRTVCEAADQSGWILAPKVRGLRFSPAEAAPAPLGDVFVGETVTLGGIFMAIPSDLFTDWGFRYDETNPPYTGDEAICAWWRANGGHCGYVQGYEVNHYERIDEQMERFPEYQARKELEMAR